MKLVSKRVQVLTPKEFKELKFHTASRGLMGPALEHIGVQDFGRVIMMKDGKDIKGWCLVYSLKCQQHFNIHVYVPENQKRQGIGKKLVNHALRFCDTPPLALVGGDESKPFWKSFGDKVMFWDIDKAEDSGWG